MELGGKRLERVHFVGIGGAGMSAIAHVALELGTRVSGTDLVVSETTRRLAAKGASITQGHSASNLDTPDAVVVSTAIAPDNPEVVEATRRGIPVLHRAQMLAIIMERKKGIAVSGTHGKTTTTSMLAVVFKRLGLDPTWLVGGEVLDLGSGAGYGEGDYLIAEADESDASFLELRPYVALATNIDDDHLDHYGSLSQIVQAFETFLRRTREGGFPVVCVDNPDLAAIARRLEGRLVTYSGPVTAPGLPAGLEQAVRPAGGRSGETVRYRVSGYSPRSWGAQFSVERSGTPIGEFTLNVPGPHNVSNATAVIATAVELGLDAREVAPALATFSGAGRRLERMGRVRDVEVVDDYAHHPTEVAATLSTVRSLVPSSRLVVVFQPHRFSRTRALYSAFGRAFPDADVVVFTDIYPAGERPVPGVTGELLYNHFSARPGQEVTYIPALADVAPYLAERLRPGDLVMTMGAGNVRQVGPQLLALLDGLRSTRPENVPH
ncbi:MAG: UDP-N-acetylmuramate--L-alanine ligase [Bacillota bacterium]|nr:MAG: UDP-N-acetylmuramate--L-alanine ligase [Bacillota bacterium]